MSKSAKYRREAIRACRAMVAAAHVGPYVPAPVSTLRPVEVVVLPRLEFPLRWKSWDQCALCGLRGKMTVDHIRPLSRGGWDCASNRQPLCQTCNVVKSNEIIQCVQQYERILVESLGRQGRAHMLPTVSAEASEL